MLCSQCPRRKGQVYRACLTAQARWLLQQQITRSYIAAYGAACVIVARATAVAAAAVICAAQIVCTNRNIMEPFWAELTGTVTELLGTVRNCGMLQCS